MTDTALQESRAASMAGKYLTFRLGPETYGIEILCVQEIIGLLPITRIPKVSEYIRGVINLRGKVIPVMSLSRRFGVPDREDTALTCVIVIELAREHDTVTMGIVVDEVSEVININAENIESPGPGGRPRRRLPSRHGQSGRQGRHPAGYGPGDRVQRNP